MATDRDSYDQSDGDGGRWRSPTFASTQHFLGNLRSGRHDHAVTQALAVADAALARHLRLCGADAEPMALARLKYRNWKRSRTVSPHKAYRRRTYREVKDTTDEYPKGRNSCLVLI